MTFSKAALLKLFLVSLAMSTCFVSRASAQELHQEDPLPPKIIRKSGGVLQSSATRRVEPAYPPLAKAAAIGGAVVVEVTIDEEGNVIAARPISGHPLLKDAAVAAANGWVFAPTKLQGIPVKVIGTITFNFSIDDTERINALKTIIAANPNSPEPLFQLGEIYRANRKYDEAIEAYKHAVDVKPDYGDALLALAKVYESAGRLDEAQEAVSRVLVVAPKLENADDALSLLGSTYLRQNRFDEALNAYQRAVEVNPKSQGAHYALCVIYIKRGDKQAAIREYQAVAEVDSVIAERQLKPLIDRMP